MAEVDIICGDIELRPGERKLTGPKGIAHVRPHVAVLLRALMQRAGENLTYESLIGAMAPKGDCALTTLLVHAHYARVAIRTVGSAAKIVNLRGIGYELQPSDAAAARVLRLTERQHGALLRILADAERRLPGTRERVGL
jgi:DNA-binding response OmpR family regulator